MSPICVGESAYSSSKTVWGKRPAAAAAHTIFKFHPITYTHARAHTYTNPVVKRSAPNTNPYVKASYAMQTASRVILTFTRSKAMALSMIFFIHPLVGGIVRSPHTHTRTHDARAHAQIYM